MCEAKNNKTKFQGFRSPNYTMVPDELFDELLADLSGAELKVLLYVIRRTFGFKKGSDRISKAQLEKGIQRADGTVLDRGTGLSRRAIRLAVDSLVEQNILIKYTHESAERGYESTEYALNIRTTTDTPWVKSTQALGKKVPKGLGRGVPIQETVLQQTVEQETDISNIRKASPSEINDEIEDDSTGEDNKPQQFERLENILARKKLLPETRAYAEERQAILSYIDDFSREFSDRAPLKSSTTRAYNLFRRSGLSLDVFIQAMYQARSVTKERTAAIRTTSKDPDDLFPTKHKMAYFFAILEEKLGLREETDPKNPTPGSPKSP